MWLETKKHITLAEGGRAFCVLRFSYHGRRLKEKNKISLEIMESLSKIVKKRKHNGIRVMFCGKDDWNEAAKIETEILSSIYDIEDFFFLLPDYLQKDDPDIKFCNEHTIELINHSKDIILTHPQKWESAAEFLVYLAE